MSALQKIQAVYSRVPSANCQGLCQGSCGPIVMTVTEWQNMGRPRPAIVENGIAMLEGKSNLTCHLLKDGKCSEYEQRPLICRLWGVVDEMPCVFGCKPDRVLTDREAKGMLAQVRRISNEAEGGR